MADQDWIDILLGGSLEVILPTWNLLQAGSVRFHGSGRLVWNRDSGLRILGVTDGAEALGNTFDRLLRPVRVPLGQLIPKDTYVTAAGRTQDGWDASTIPVPLKGYTVSSDSPHVLCDITGNGLTLTRSVKRLREHARILRALLGPPPKDWPRVTRTEIHNEFFGGGSFTSDWLQATTRLGCLVARQRSDRWVEVRMIIENEADLRTSFEIIQAVARAFGFMLGRRIWIQGVEDLRSDNEIRQLYRYREPTENSLRPPLGEGTTTYLSYAETLLGSAVDFFLTERGQEVAQYLDLCWDTVDNDFRTSVAVVSICVESLLRLVSEDVNETDPGYTQADRDALLSWTSSNEGSLSERFLSRVRGFVTTLGQGRPIDVLRAWQRQGMLGVTEEDIAAWERSRHPAAHGAFGRSDAGAVELQRRVDRFHRVQNLMNRIVLHLIGYQGPYIDYAQGWREAQFPPSQSGTDPQTET